MKPLIGVCGEFAEVDVYDARLPAHFSLTNYARAVQKAGGVPVILPITDDHDDIDVILERIDGVLVTGGVDVDPGAYGQEREPEVAETQPFRDAFEFALIRRLVERNMPTLAVCRGIQSVSVALGGELTQHVDGQMCTELYNDTAHQVAIEPDSRLASIVGTTDLGVNSLHHQVVSVPPPGARVVARNPDGHIEGIELDVATKLVAVQWHPEMMRHRAEHLALFQHLVRLSSD
ncbi:MAG: gamma-glutamyl-gamma-aminobutyrate hydrolase family protein [Actinomycetota bacterium]